VDGYKVFQIRIYEGDSDRIHAQMHPVAPSVPVAASNPPVQPLAPKPRLRPAGSAVAQGNSLPGVAVPAVSADFPEDEDENVPF
jgi:hypothetical protein